MSGQLQFGGVIPFNDRASGVPVQVNVWGTFVGTGVDAHEEAAIQQWIMNALASSAASYDGNVHDLPARAQEWGQWVSQQLNPQLAQTFQAQGQIQIQGVQIQGAPGAAAPMAGKDPYGKMATSGAKPMAAGGSPLLDKAASAIAARLGVPHAQAHQAAAIVMEVLQAHGALSGGMGAPAGAVHDPHAKQVLMQQQQQHMQAPKGAVHDPYAKQAILQQQQQPGKDPNAYAKQAPAKDPYGKGAPNPQSKDPYGKGAPAAQSKDPYGKGAPAAQGKDPQGKGGTDWKK